MQLRDPLAQCQLYADLSARVLICRRCRYALATANSQVSIHLRDKHNEPEELRRSLTHHLKYELAYTFQDPAEVALRKNGSPVHPHLHLHDGFACRQCTYHTVNYGELTKHLSKNHLNGRHSSRSRIDHLYDDVYLQSWTNGSSRRYWTVENYGSLIRPVLGRDTCEYLQAVQNRERQHLELEAQASLQNRETARQTFATTGPWMDRTRWQVVYKDVRRDHLLGLTETVKPTVELSQFGPSTGSTGYVNQSSLLPPS